ncbi:sugar transporter [Gigaspora margarita]|uniref:Sugar transporter n=1 Tax=Gigaspora margarita TaxID=4874 RepID=A0A8H4B010_GIGMA|nr:sugar transporter [Gigaspora margarita]
MIKKNWNISIQNDPAKNLEQFLGPDANLSELKEACLHYQPCKKETDHLEIIICTREQQYKHKLLLFIILVIDDNNKGISVTFIIFIPPPQNWLTLSGYDSKILERLLTIFCDKISDIYNKNQLKENPNAILITFSPLVAITDANVKEYKALLIVWSEIILIICYFYISQYWRNEINKQLGRGGKSDIILQQQTMKAYLKSMLKEV